MRGVLRMFVLCYSWLPLQQVLLLVGAALILIGHLSVLGEATTSSSALIALASVAMGLILIFMPMTLSTGVMWRGVSVPRVFGLLPYGRLKLLMGVLGATVVFALFVTANIALFILEVPATFPPQTSLTALFVGALAMTTGTVFFGFLVIGSRRAVLTAVVVSSIVWLLTHHPDAIHGIGEKVSMTQLLAWATLGAWGAFAAWYLRAQRITAPALSGRLVLNSFGHIRMDEEADVSGGLAINIRLLGESSLGRVLRRGLLLVGIVLLVQVVLSVFSSTSEQVYSSTLVILIISVLPSGLATQMSLDMTYRSRSLWLVAGSREQLFLLCERLAWRHIGATTLPAAVFGAATWILRPHPATDWRYLVAASLAATACGLYLGLLSVRGWRFGETVLAALIAIPAWGSLLVSCLLPSTPVTPAMTAIPIAELIGAVILRWVARRRWQRIDWLVCRPPRLASRALGSGV